MDTPAPLTTAPRPPQAPPSAARPYREHGHWRDDPSLDDLRGRAENEPERTVLVDRAAGDRHEITAADLADRVERVAQGLRAAGVRPREAVAYQTANRWEAVAR